MSLKNPRNDIFTGPTHPGVFFTSAKYGRITNYNRSFGYLLFDDGGMVLLPNGGGIRI